VKSETNEDHQEVGQIHSSGGQEYRLRHEGICSSNTASTGQPCPDKVGLDQTGTTSLEAIAIKANTHPKHRFQDLYRMLNLAALAKAWNRLNKNASAGVDRVTAQAYGENLLPNLIGLEQRLRTKRYRCKAVRRSFIPKSNGKQRPLGIPALEDKIVQQAVSDILRSIFEWDFSDSSFAYREGRGAGDATQSLAANLQWGPFGYVVEADIQSFFDHVDHDWMMRMLEQRIDDKALLGLIEQWLKAPVIEVDGSSHRPDKGTPQGGVISPMLANIYLHYVLDHWFERKIRPKLKARSLLIRYADDYILAFQNHRDARALYGSLPARLKKFGLTVAPEKTALTRFSRFRPSMRRRFKFLGFEYYWWNDQKGRARLMRRTARSKLKELRQVLKLWLRQNRNRPLPELAAELRVKMLGHYRYFAVKGNGQSVGRYYTMVTELLFKWLNRCSQRRSYNWTGFLQLLQLMRLPKPSSATAAQKRVFWLFEKGVAVAR